MSANSIRLALLRILDPEAAAILETESKRRTSADADSTAPSVEYLAHRAHVEAVQESLKTFGAPVPVKPKALTPAEIREMQQERISRSLFFPEEGDDR